MLGVVQVKKGWQKARASESDPGRGATFVITLPTATEASAIDAPATPPRPRRTARVLVVDDEPQVLATLVELMQSVGHTVVAAGSGAAALETYRPGQFDVVLTNVGMAGMNGWEVAERLRAQDREVGIVFITGWGMREDDYSRMVALKIETCLFKPVRPAELDAAIQASRPA